MKKKNELYALVCTNEEEVVVSVSLHATKKDAQKQMREEYKNELDDLKASGYFEEDEDPDDYGCFISKESASTGVGYLETYYLWSINKTELPTAKVA